LIFEGDFGNYRRISILWLLQGSRTVDEGSQKRRRTMVDGGEDEREEEEVVG
jgi:hypothetical protein